MSVYLNAQIIRKGLMTGLLVTFLLLFIKWIIEHTTLYHSVNRATYTWLLSGLNAPRNLSELPVVILDIKDLEYRTEQVGDEKFQVTPRAELLSLIDALVSLDDKPKAVGVDIDFSPHKFGYGDLQDPAHFRTLMALRKTHGVPIYLGINRSQDRNQSLWLGDPEFASLAANVDNPPDNRKMYEWTSGSGTDSEDIEEHEKALSMSSALASAGKPPGHALSSPVSWIIKRSSKARTEYDRAASEFLVDFSALDILRDSRLTTVKAEAVKSQKRIFAGKAVLIGDGSLYDARDTVIIPLEKESRPVPGIYLHATAAYTLLKSPLYEFTGLGRLLADVSLALFVLMGVMLARAYIATWKTKFNKKRTTYILISLVTFFVVVFGIFLLPKTRLIWDDFVFVLFALWIHPLVEDRLWGVWDWLKLNVPLFLKEMFSDEEEEEESA